MANPLEMVKLADGACSLMRIRSGPLENRLLTDLSADNGSNSSLSYQKVEVTFLHQKGE